MNIDIDRINKYIQSSHNLFFEEDIGEGKRVDILDRTTNTVWELKCKKRLTELDFKQVEKYININNNYTYKILNIFTEELWCLSKASG